MPLLEEAGVRTTCVELTGLPSASATRATCSRCRPTDGPVLWPIDRETIARVWSEQGYPAGGAYRD